MPAQTRASKRKTAILTTPSSPNSEPESNDAEWHGIQNDQPSENEGSEEKECDDEEENNDDEKEEDGDDEDKDDADADQPINPTQARNARAPVWQAWQDCLLITQVNLDCPFLLPRCSRAASWDGTANVLAISSAQQGQSSYFTRSGEACRARFNYLRKKYKADQVRSLQKTGTDEEIDAFMELLGELCSLMEAETAPTKTSRKTDLETQAGQELHDASMMGLVRGDNLVDVASLAGSSVCERQAQWGKKRKNSDDKENQSESRNTTCKRRKKQNSALADILNQRIEDDKAALVECSRNDADKHAQQMAVLNKLADCVQGLNNRLSGLQDEQEKMNKYLQQQELERREAAIRRREQELGIDTAIRHHSSIISSSTCSPWKYSCSVGGGQWKYCDVCG